MASDATDAILREYVDDLCARATIKYEYHLEQPERWGAWKDLRALTDPRLIPVLQDKLAGKPRAEVSEACFTGLCTLVELHKDRAGANYLLRQLAGAWQTCRIFILRRLVNFVLLCDSELAFQCVHPFLESENVLVRTAAAGVLGRVGHPLCITALLQYLQAATKDEDFHAALQALEACGDGTLLPFTLDYAYTSHGRAYWPAITCISSWLRADATPFLISVLERQRHNREVAVAELAKWGDERAIPIIEKRLKAQLKRLASDYAKGKDTSLPWDLTDEVKYLMRHRAQSNFDAFNAQLVELLPQLPSRAIISIGRYKYAELRSLLGLLEPESA